MEGEEDNHAVAGNGEEGNSPVSEGQFTEKYAAFLSQHKENKARLKAEATRFVEDTNEVIRNAYMDKLQNVDEQLQNLMAEKQQLVAAKSRNQKEILPREELPNLDDLDKDFHTILKMRKVASDKVEALAGTMSPGKLSKGEELLGNLDSILAKRALLVDKISSFCVHMAGHDSLQMTPELHAQLDEIHKSKWELAADMRTYSGTPAPISEVACLQRRLNDLHKTREDLLTEMHDNGESQQLFPTQKLPPRELTNGDASQTPEVAAEPGLATSNGQQKIEAGNGTQASQDEAQKGQDDASSGAQQGQAEEDEDDDRETENLVWRRTDWPTKTDLKTRVEKAKEPAGPDSQERTDDPQASDMKVIREASKGEFSVPALPTVSPPEVPQDGASKEEADAVLFSELKRLVDLLKTEVGKRPAGAHDLAPRRPSDLDRGVDEVASLAQSMRSKIEDLQNALNDVGSGRANGTSSKSASLKRQIEEKRNEVMKIEEFVGLCKQCTLVEAEGFVPIVQAKMNVLKSDISGLESQTIEMQTSIEDTGISQPAAVPEVTLQPPPSDLRDLSPPSLQQAKLRVREALDNVASSAIAFCAFGLAVFVLGIFAPVGFPCWGPAICLATVGAFYSYTKSNGIDSPLYPATFRNGAILACVLLLISAVLFGLAFLSIRGLRGTPACSSAILYSPECGEPLGDGVTEVIFSDEMAPRCFNDLTMAEYDARVTNCEKLFMCYNGKVKLASCDMMVAINGFGAIFSVSLAVTVVCISMWVYFHLETRMKEYHLLEEQRANDELYEDRFVPLSTAMCLTFFGCGCCCRCCHQSQSDDLEAGMRTRSAGF